MLTADNIKAGGPNMLFFSDLQSPLQPIFGDFLKNKTRLILSYFLYLILFRIQN